MTLKSLAIGLALWLACCGGSEVSPGNSIQGSVSGTTIAAADCAFHNTPPDSSGSTHTEAAVVNAASVCGALSKSQLPKNLGSLMLLLGTGDSAVTSPGTFSVGVAATGSSPWADGVWTVENASCQTVTEVAATAGTVTVTTVSSSSLVGTFDLTFGTDHVTGTFSASSCPMLNEMAVGTCT